MHAVDPSRTGRALQGVLAEAIALLRAHGEDHWARALAGHLHRLSGGGEGLDLLGAFGGMGSLNDLVIHPVNGHRIDESEIGVVNADFARLRSEMWDLLGALRAGSPEARGQ
ncbi:hypothetical protein N865_20315 [Intrasporangium oryzae NRRL B-24470]|uniref:DUF6966 domain-containing protein n=2 Tax=Intrasporangium TaxID=53357 RepID=W9G7N0_9MICO|nr:hypothetical protein N865_20315 [Intrasporangium oryzae NRRL B-24470]